MNIRVRTGGMLGEHLPPGSSRNRADLDVMTPATPHTVMTQLGIPTDKPYLVAVNGKVVPPSALASQPLGPDDELSILPALRGG